tara:strand:- start:70 stop:945 length:876 start_codon:yes stop_codon:yes gene_type:complete
MAQTTTDNSSEVTTVNTTVELNRQKISKINESQKSDTAIVNSLIKSINNKTNRVETGFYAEENEFVYRKGRRPVKKGTPYHIHYTTDLKIYYMTRLQHSQILSELITRVSNFSTTEIYNRLNPQQSMILKPTIVIPDIDDYKKEYIKRYFAKKTNEKSNIFEISEKDFQRSPLYDYAELNWFIKGDRKLVKETNIISINMAIGEYNFPGLKKVIPEFQYYREQEGLNKKENIEKKLQPMMGQNTTSTTQSQTSQQQQSNVPPPSPGYGAGAQAPPTGTMTGGGGGTGGGSY